MDAFPRCAHLELDVRRGTLGAPTSSFCPSSYNAVQSCVEFEQKLNIPRLEDSVVGARLHRSSRTIGPLFCIGLFIFSSSFVDIVVSALSR